MTDRRSVDAVSIDPRMSSAVLAWGRQQLRPLPWRSTRDPWAILVAETMLQQTQVARVIDAYGRFLETFPTAVTCANAPVAAVIRLWEGLGYNRRAVRLHAAAQQLVRDHDGRVPADLTALLALPGVGAYTARAVMVFAFEQPVGVLDTNAGRVLARLVAGRRLTVGEAQRIADAAADHSEPWLWNQSILDLGATVCRARAPDCPSCPVRDHCVWAARGHPSPDPARDGAASPRPQATFEGSDRQLRGRLVNALRSQTIAADQLAAIAGADDPTRVGRLADDLVAEGIAQWRADRLALAGDESP